MKYMADAGSGMVTLRVAPELLAAIDRVRGGVPRAAWIKRLCADAVAAHDALGSGGQRRQLVPGPDVEAVVSSSRAKAHVRPIPRG